MSGDRSLPAATAPQPATAAAPAATTAASPAAANPQRPALAPAKPESASSSAVARLPQLGAPALDGPVRVGGAVRAPIRIFNVDPIYPEEAQTAHVEGVVILRITVGEDGSVRDALVLRSIPELDQAAINAALQWQYEPTLLNGAPVEVEMTVTINFTLR